LELEVRRTDSVTVEGSGFTTVVVLQLEAKRTKVAADRAKRAVFISFCGVGFAVTAPCGVSKHILSSYSTFGPKIRQSLGFERLALLI